MDDVRAWLQSLGLAQYADAFEENDLDWDLLPELDPETLKDLGVNSAGHRLRILKAVRSLGETADAHELSSPSSLPADPTDGAERRQLTVMFSDLVGSTELSTKLDPEDLRDINRSYQDAVTACVEHFGGYVARYMGDGVLAYFGYPQAHEDDAERAVRAALRIVDSVPALDTPVRLAVRVGIATGPVVVGDVIGDGASQESAVVGETPNLAARLEGVAGSNEVIIAAATNRLIGNRFELQSLGSVELKGLDNPGEVFKVLGVREGSRFDLDRTEGLRPIAGRAEEINVLQRRWHLSSEGEGQVAMLTGESGIGKSRLVQAFLERASPCPAAIVDLHCSPFGINDAFHPLAEYLARTAGITSDASPAENRHRIASWLEGTADEIEFAESILARTLSISAQDPLPPEITPQVQKARTIAAVVANLLRVARHGPLFVMVEDAQWADPSTWELLEALTEAGALARVFIVLTMRPGPEPPWQGRGNVTHLSLNRLGRGDTSELISDLLGQQTLPDELVDVIMERTDGTPLFVEELVRSLVETEFLRRSHGAYEINRSANMLAVPSTLQDSLMARLDRLGPAKEVAQTGALLGREFSHDLIAHISELDNAALDEGLGTLASTEILGRRSGSTGSQYFFRQSLVREAAYASLLLSRRRALHNKVVSVLEALPEDAMVGRHQLLAHHSEFAGNLEKAFRYACLAAEEQAGEYAIEEACQLYLHALQMAGKSEEQLEGVDRTTVLHRLAELRFTQGRFADSAEYASQMRALASKSGDIDAEATALLDMAMAYMWLEDFDTALAITTEAQRLADEAGLVGAHAGAATLGGYIHGVSGRLDESQALLDESIGLAEKHQQPKYLPQALFMGACIQNWTGHYDDAISIADRGRASAQEQGQIAHYLRCHWARATARIGKGDLAGGYQDLVFGLDIAQKMGDQSYIPRYLNTLGWLYDECYAFDHAIAHCERAVEFDRGSTGATGVERLAFAQTNWADAFLGLGDLQAAKEMLDSVHGIATNPRTHEWMRWRYTTHVLASMGQYWIAAGNPRDAAQWIGRCLEIASEKASWKYVALARRLSGVVHMHAKDWDSAAAELTQAHSIAVRIGYPNGVWRAHSDIANLMEAKGDRSAAEHHLLEAQSILRRARQAISDEPLASMFGTAGEARVLLAT